MSNKPRNHRAVPQADRPARSASDGTEIRTAEGKLYLASVLDIGSRRILGLALSGHHDAQLAYGALAMAAAVRGGQVTGVILHTDQGRRVHRGCVPAGV